MGKTWCTIRHLVIKLVLFFFVLGGLLFLMNQDRKGSWPFEESRLLQVVKQCNKQKGLCARDPETLKHWVEIRDEKGMHIVVLCDILNHCQGESSGKLKWTKENCSKFDY